MEIAPIKFPIAPGNARARTARALLFVALSAFAVPACQHYDAGDKPEGSQALQRIPTPEHAIAAAGRRSA